MPASSSPGISASSANGETVVRLEERLGYVHKGIERLMIGKTPAEAARIAARISGDSTVAHALAFARAVEAALALEPPPRAHWLRAIMAELERIANHVGDIGAICNDATFPLLLAELHGAARADAARRRRLLRPSPDDGLRRAGRRGGRSRRRRRASGCAV